MDKFEGIATKWVPRFLSLPVLVFSLYLLWKGDSAGGAVAALIAFGLAAFNYVSAVTEISGFGVKAKLDSKIAEADKILHQMRLIAAEVSRSTFMSLAWMNRLGGPPFESIQDRVSALDELMHEIELSEEARRSAKAPFISMMYFDAAMIIRQLINEVIAAKNRVLNEKLKEHTGGEPMSQEDPVIQSIQEQQRKLNAEKFYVDPTDTEKVRSFPQQVKAYLSNLDLEESEMQKIVEASERAFTIVERATKRGNRTEELQEYLSKYENSKTLYSELFVES